MLWGGGVGRKKFGISTRFINLTVVSFFPFINEQGEGCARRPPPQTKPPLPLQLG